MPRSPIPSNTKVADKGIWEIGEVEEKVIKPSQWGQIAAKVYKAFSVTHDKLPAGCYSVTKDNNDRAMVFVGKYIKADKIVRFKNDLADKILKEIDDFWNKEQAFADNGFLHKRGYLLYGAQGTGKSSIIWQVARDVIERDGVVFVCEKPQFLSEGLKVFRQVEKNRAIVCVFEDVDATVDKYGESELLALLDGDSQINRVINIATTNYPEKLDKRIVSRPRRFDRIYKILPPNTKIRTAFLKEKLPNGEDVKMWAQKTKGLSFAAVAETLISVLCLGNKLDPTIKILKDIESKSPSSSDFGKGVGFGKGDDCTDDEDF